ncbi:MAG TPA: Fe-S protein assembly co-chaperone HscB [Nitrospiria bacterium]|nr:Fe-S protein assembly co-chaperone HscB [Nitrospiria bacterium]
MSREKDSLARSLCWNCQSEVGGEYFCDQCIKIQPAASDLDYFQQLGLPRHLAIDLHDLERRFHELSRKIHPDLFQRRSDKEKAISLQNSAMLNAAYRALRDPILRVEYLINLEEGAVKDIPAKAPPDLLEEILELQESLEEYRQFRTKDPQRSAALRETLMTEREKISSRKIAAEKGLFRLFDEWDRWQDQRYSKADEPRKNQQSLLQRMKDFLSVRAYLNTVLRDLDEGLRDLS